MATDPVVPFQFLPTGYADAPKVQADFDEFLKYIRDRNAGTTAWDSFVAKGTATNDSAAIGNVGEYVSNYAAGVAAAATTTYGNITSISLTAGDWDVSGVGQSDVIATVTRFLLAISAFSGNTTTDHTGSDNVVDGPVPTAGANGNAAIPEWRVSIASTTTIYLKARLTYGSGSPTVTGRLSARRRR